MRRRLRSRTYGELVWGARAGENRERRGERKKKKTSPGPGEAGEGKETDQMKKERGKEENAGGQSTCDGQLQPGLRSTLMP